MSKPFDNLRKRMAPSARARANAMTAALRNQMPLYELRQALDLTQAELATTLRVKQATISKLERRTDMYVSTLARFIAAMGGELELRARFPAGEVKISSFEGLKATAESKDHEPAGH